MKTPYRILVPLDGSPEAESILAAVRPLARQDAVHLTLFSAVPPGNSGAEAKECLLRALARLLRHDIYADIKLDWGEPAKAIAHAAAPSGQDLIALSTHGQTGSRQGVLGSVASEVVRQAKIPVLIARPGLRMHGWKHLIVAVDGSFRSTEALVPAGRLARILGATVHLLGVEEDGVPLLGEPEAGTPVVSTADYLRQASSRLVPVGIRTEVEVRQGPTAQQIVKFDTEIRAGLIALASRGLGQSGQALVGEVVEQVIASAQCPVLLTRVVERLPSAVKSPAPSSPTESRGRTAG